MPLQDIFVLSERVQAMDGGSRWSSARIIGFESDWRVRVAWEWDGNPEGTITVPEAARPRSPEGWNIRKPQQQMALSLAGRQTSVISNLTNIVRYQKVCYVLRYVVFNVFDCLLSPQWLLAVLF